MLAPLWTESALATSGFSASTKSMAFRRAAPALASGALPPLPTGENADEPLIAADRGPALVNPASAISARCRGTFHAALIFDCLLQSAVRERDPRCEGPRNYL